MLDEYRISERIISLPNTFVLSPSHTAFELYLRGLELVEVSGNSVQTLVFSHGLGKLDVHAASRDIGHDGDGPWLAGLRHDGINLVDIVCNNKICFYSDQ